MFSRSRLVGWLVDWLISWLVTVQLQCFLWDTTRHQENYVLAAHDSLCIFITGGLRTRQCTLYLVHVTLGNPTPPQASLQKAE